MIHSGEHRDRVALITGGSGKAIVNRLASEGANVWVLDIDAKPWHGPSRSAADQRSRGSHEKE